MIFSVYATISYAFTNQIVARIDEHLFTEYDIKVHFTVLQALMKEKISSRDFIDTYTYSKDHLDSSINAYLTYQDAVKLRRVKKIMHGTLRNYVQGFHKKFASSEIKDAFYKKLDVNEREMEEVLSVLYTTQNYFFEIYHIDIFGALDDDSRKKITEMYTSMRKKYSITYPTEN